MSSRIRGISYRQFNRSNPNWLLVWDSRGASDGLRIHMVVTAPEEADMKSILLLCALAAALPLTSMAQEARSTKWVNLRAGPARDYPLVARLGPGTPLAVQGCTE